MGYRNLRIDYHRINTVGQYAFGRRASVGCTSAFGVGKGPAIADGRAARLLVEVGTACDPLIATSSVTALGGVKRRVRTATPKSVHCPHNYGSVKQSESS